MQFCDEVFGPQWFPVIGIAFGYHKQRSTCIVCNDRKLETIGLLRTKPPLGDILKKPMLAYPSPITHPPKRRGINKIGQVGFDDP